MKLSVKKQCSTKQRDSYSEQELKAGLLRSKRCISTCQKLTYIDSCEHLVRSTSIAVVGTTLQITIPTAIKNKQYLCIVIAQNIPSNVTADMNVQIVNGSSTLNILTPCNNFLYADQLTCRKVLRLRVATDTLVAKLRNNCAIRCTRHVFPIIPTTATISDIT